LTACSPISFLLIAAACTSYGPLGCIEESHCCRQQLNLLNLHSLYNLIYTSMNTFGSLNRGREVGAVEIHFRIRTPSRSYNCRPTKIALSLGYASEELSLLPTWQERITVTSDTEVDPIAFARSSLGSRSFGIPQTRIFHLGLSQSYSIGGVCKVKHGVAYLPN
jgi:hypothetical protein